MRNIQKIQDTGKTVFNKNDIKNILLDLSAKAVDVFIYRAKQKGFLLNPFYGIYTLKKHNIFELASKLKKKSYTSMETVLKKEAVIFQQYSDIFLISDNSVTKTIGQQVYVFSKIKDSILLNPLWIINTWKYLIASKERAICDRLYLNCEYYFDDLSRVDRVKLEEISQIYNKRVILEVKKLIKNETK